MRSLITMLLLATATCVSAHTVVDDDFDDNSLAAEWIVSLDGVDLAEYAEVETQLEVTDIVTSEDEDWGRVLFVRALPGLQTFRVDVSIYWDSAVSPAAMQRLYVRVLNSAETIARVGYSDGWLGTSGQYSAGVGDNSTNSGPGSLPLSGMVDVAIVRDGDAVSLYWNGGLILEGTDVIPADALRLEFYHYHIPGGGDDPSSIFGTESIDRVTVTDLSDCSVADISGPTGIDGIVNIRDLLHLLDRWGPCSGGCSADITGDGVVNVSDLLLMLGEWGDCK